MGQISLKRLLDDGDTLMAYCTGLVGNPVCSHGNVVDIAALMARVGDWVDLYSPEVQKLFVCKRCKRRGARFISTPNPRWSSSAGRDEIAAEERRKKAADPRSTS